MKSFIQAKESSPIRPTSPFIGKANSRSSLLSGEQDSPETFLKPIEASSVQTLSSSNGETETLVNSPDILKTSTMEEEPETVGLDVQKKCDNCGGEKETESVFTSKTIEEKEPENIATTKTIEEKEAQTVTSTVTDHCSIKTGKFTSIPSGKIAAYYSGGKYGAAFNMNGAFNVNIPCHCGYGEYRQYVKGYFKKNGRNVTHPLCGTNLSSTAYQEDCGLSGGKQYKYGYRNNKFGTSYFAPDQAGGCSFKGYDYPGITATSGDNVEINLHFVGKLIDTSRGNLVLKSSAWSVEGTSIIP